MLNESKAMNEGDIFKVISSVVFFSFHKVFYLDIIQMKTEVERLEQ